MIYIFNQPIPTLTQNQGKYVKFGKFNPQPNGSVTVSDVNGNVLSVQPNGEWQIRPAGANGQYEMANLSGNIITYNPTADETGVFNYPVFVTSF